MTKIKQKLCGIIGYPLTHSLSPIMHNKAFADVGLDWFYMPFTVKEEDLKDALKGFKAIGVIGLNVTMPYKKKVIPYLDEIAHYANLVGAVNTIHYIEDKIVGYNTDGRGFIDAITEGFKFISEDKKILLIGAGGAARAVAVSLAMEGAKSIIIANRTFEHANDIKEILDNHFSKCESKVVSLDKSINQYFKNVDMIVNATPIGMYDNEKEIPFSFNNFTENHYVIDLIYKPLQTEFLKRAKERGAKTANGLDMLIYQGAAAFKIWTNIDAPIEVMKKAIIEEIKGAN